jgi:hypothetical protein
MSRADVDDLRRSRKQVGEIRSAGNVSAELLLPRSPGEGGRGGDPLCDAESSTNRSIHRTLEIVHLRSTEKRRFARLCEASGGLEPPTASLPWLEAAVAGTGFGSFPGFALGRFAADGHRSPRWAPQRLHHAAVSALTRASDHFARQVAQSMQWTNFIRVGPPAQQGTLPTPRLALTFPLVN